MSMLSRVTFAVLVLSALMFPAGTMELSGITLFGADADGNQNVRGRWNSGPKDAAWDLFVHEGAAIQSDAPVAWLNDAGTNRVRIALTPGEHTFTFHFDAESPFEWYGLNLFFDDSAPGISAVVPLAQPENAALLRANAAPMTMGLPISTAPGAGRLSETNRPKHLWQYEGTGAGLRCTLTDFRVLAPEAAGGLDLVGSLGPEPSGRPDWVGQFTITVSEAHPPPPGWLLWIGAVAGIDIGKDSDMHTWRDQFGFAGANPPFTFRYGGREAGELLGDWKMTAETTSLDAARTAHTIRWNDPETGLEVRWEGVAYGDYPVVEWTVYLENKGAADTPIIEALRPLDVHLDRGGDEEYLLHHWNGTLITEEDFATKQTSLPPGETLDLRPAGGRATGGNWPYYNLEAGDEGVILAVSWAGRWYTTFTRDEDLGLDIVAGQEDCHFLLHPGEVARTPLIAMLFWEGGDWIDAQNLWRRWMVELNVPRSHGELPPLPQLNGCSSHQFAEMTKADEACQKQFIDLYLEKGLKLDYWWMDAGWYVHAAEDNWPKTGTWEVDRRPHRFPNGLRAITDHAHAKGVKSIVWFEPERVHSGTWLADEHPEWVIGGKEGGLLDLGDPDAWRWAADHFSGLIESEGIDLYRQDYNIDPLPFWRQKDTEDRVGITENKYVMGYLAYWDALVERHPGLMIDSCASGGHRNDLETMRRAIPLLRSDFLFEPVGQQGHTYGLSFWLPFHGTGYCPPNTTGWGWGAGTDAHTPYVRRSNMCPSNIGLFDFRAEVDEDLLMKLYHEWLEIGPMYIGDYYPLTPYNLDAGQWLAWQFNRPDSGDGFVQAFRRDASVFSAAQLPLRGLDPGATYRVKDYDVEGERSYTGAQLMIEGVQVTIGEKPGAVTLRYVKAK